MKHSKILLLLAVTFIMIATLLIFLKPNNVKALVQDNAVTKEQESFNRTDSIYPRHNLTLSKTELEKAAKETVLFHEIQAGDLEVNTLLPLAKSGKGMAIRYDQNIIETKKIGDEVRFQMLEYGLNRSGEIVEIEKIDDDILRWHGRFQQGNPELNFFTITQSQKDQYTIMQIYTDKGNYTAEIKNGRGIVQGMDEGVEDHELHAHDH
ncbi:metalloprotease secretion chaperone CpaB [Acinetobacter haemolyticus]|uniref:metalloprotease secretion chaperone CpaB n=1 Tax=Acinetobacter haemolyticus TaxID=29430 RepID=UPI003F559011